MIFESCAEIRSYFSDYVDGVCDAKVVRSIRYHLSGCKPCKAELERYRSLQADLRSLGRRQVPGDVALRLRVQVSRHLHRNVAQRLRVRLENLFRPVLFPSLGGLTTALVFMMLVLGVGMPRRSNVPDVTLAIETPPTILELAPMNFDVGNNPLVVVTYVNARGEVTSYKVLSGPRSPKLMESLDRMMYFSLFHPATSFGVPTSGRLVLSLRQITVRG